MNQHQARKISRTRSIITRMFSGGSALARLKSLTVCTNLGHLTCLLTVLHLYGSTNSLFVLSASCPLNTHQHAVLGTKYAVISESYPATCPDKHALPHTCRLQLLRLTSLPPQLNVPSQAWPASCKEQYSTPRQKRLPKPLLEQTRLQPPLTVGSPGTPKRHQRLLLMGRRPWLLCCERQPRRCKMQRLNHGWAQQQQLQV